MSKVHQKRRTAAPTVATLSSNVVQTAAKAATVLGHFKTTLQQNGMTGAIDAYRKMADTLINQRLWMQSHEPELGKEHFRQIAAEAREIHEVLSAYAQLMAKLMLLPQVVEMTAKGEPGTAPEAGNRADQLLMWLKQRSRPASATQIRAALRLSTAELNAHLRQLEESGRVVKETSAGRELYSPAPGR
jgi:biotin operon repressor